MENETKNDADSVLEAEVDELRSKLAELEVLKTAAMAELDDLRAENSRTLDENRALRSRVADQTIELADADETIGVLRTENLRLDEQRSELQNTVTSLEETVATYKGLAGAGLVGTLLNLVPRG